MGNRESRDCDGYFGSNPNYCWWQSTQQALYFFQEAILNGNPLSLEDEVGAEEEGDPNEYVVGEGLNDRISKIDIGYTDPPSGRRLFSVKVDDANGKRLGKLYLDDTNDLLKMLGIDDEIPRSISFGDEKILDSIVKQLQDQGIDASWDDLMDVS